MLPVVLQQLIQHTAELMEPPGFLKADVPDVLFGLQACWAVLTASQCATYDAVKARILLATKWQDGVAAQLATSMVTGIVTTTASAPVDLVKSRIFAGERCLMIPPLPPVVAAS